MSDNPYESPSTHNNVPSTGWLVWKLPLIVLSSFVVMIPWPLLGIALSYRMFDQPDEAVLLFGGVTALFVVPIMLVASLSEAVFSAIILAAWCSALLFPPILMSRRHPSRQAIASLLVIQTAFSFAQAAMGILMILGKDC